MAITARVEVDRLGLLAVFLMVLVIGCTPSMAVPITSPPRTTALISPAEESLAASTQASLVARRVDSPPAVDGHVEDVWGTATPLQMPLTWGADGTEHALDVELRALYTEDAVYLLAQWSGEPPSAEENTVYNRFTLHWRIPEREAQRLDCDVACHTAFVDGSGRFVYANAETIPQGGSEALPVAGGWRGGAWMLEWSRSLLNSNPFDLQFADLDGSYSFLVKIFERVEGRPDPVSGRYLLVFQP